MATADVQQHTEATTSALPDYLTNPDAVLGDNDSKWRYGQAPDYSKTRKMFAESKWSNMSHNPSSHSDHL
jgi:hypothetical protein